MSNSKKQINVRIDARLHKEIKQIALDSDTTVQDYIKSLIVTDIVQKKPELKEVLQ